VQGTPRRVSATPPFPFSRPTVYEAAKCMYNYVPSENEFEREFAKFLQNASEVTAFVKLPDQFGFAIEYTDAGANLRLYYPDFVARLESGEHWLLETKGQENVDASRPSARGQTRRRHPNAFGGCPTPAPWHCTVMAECRRPLANFHQTLDILPSFPCNGSMPCYAGFSQSPAQPDVSPYGSD
jgi:Endonuclease domain